MIYAALPLVISEHPVLGTIVVEQPSTKKKGNKRTWQAHLKTIDFKDCIKFVDDAIGKQQCVRLLEKEHDTWFEVEDKTKPLWRLVVVNGTKVLFVFHHTICDGKSGVVFHRSLLAALNKVNRQKQEEEHEEEILSIVEVKRLSLNPSHWTFCGSSA